jgi:hypothetical protein
MQAFTPNNGGVSTSMAVGTASSRIASGVAHDGQSVRVVNRGDNFIAIRIGNSSVVATMTDLLMVPNSVEVFALMNQQQTHIAAIALAAGNTLSLNCGEGV